MTDNEKIKKEAKQIIDNFASAIEKVKIKVKKGKKEVGGFREEKDDMKPNSDFRKRMFDNAPQKNDDNIVAEKKSW